MYFTNYNTYKNNIRWKSDTKLNKGAPLNKKYIIASFKTINPNGADFNVNGRITSRHNLIRGTEFKANPRINNSYRHQYQTFENNENSGKIDRPIFSSNVKNFIYVSAPGGTTSLTNKDDSTEDHFNFNQPLCRFHDYRLGLNNNNNRLVSENAKRRVRNSNKPSSNICIYNNNDPQYHAEQSIQNTYDEQYKKKLLRTEYNYYNQKYSHDTKQYLHKRCKLFSDNINIGPAKNQQPDAPIITNFKNNCNKNMLPNIYDNDTENKKTQCCNTVIYKPNNSSFSTQGAVSSSARLLRLKNNTVNHSIHSTNHKHKPPNMNMQVSNSGYNNSFNNYTSKSKFNAAGYSVCHNSHPCDMSVYNRPNTR